MRVISDYLLIRHVLLFKNIIPNRREKGQRVVRNRIVLRGLDYFAARQSESCSFHHLDLPKLITPNRELYIGSYQRDETRRDLLEKEYLTKKQKRLS